MTIWKRLCGLMLVFAATAFLSGCFKSDTPILGEWGDRLSMGSKGLCLSEDGKDTQYYNILEERTHESPSRFRYIATDETDGAIPFVAKETSRAGLYLVQLEDLENSNYLYIWYHEPARTLSFFLNTDDPAIATAQQKHHISLENDSYVSVIAGRNEELLNFLDEFVSKPGDTEATCIPIL